MQMVHSLREWLTRKQKETRRGRAELKLFDNSHEADPARGEIPGPVLVLHTVGGRILGPRDLRKTPEWAKKFEDAGVPIVGDDIKSQVGATITHRVLAKLFEDRGVVLDRTYQLNVGGNMDFKNMLERDRLESKKISKTQSFTSQIPDRDLGARRVRRRRRHRRRLPPGGDRRRPRLHGSARSRTLPRRAPRPR